MIHGVMDNVPYHSTQYSHVGAEPGPEYEPYDED